MTLKLFVADDSVTIQKVIGLAFSDTDTVIESVTNGDEAQEAIWSFKPDIVLADICMPGLNGYEICSLVKRSADLSHVPVVLLVGTFEQFDESEAVRVQYDARLTKPFDTLELVDIVQNLVGRNAMSPEIVSDAAAGREEQEPLSDVSSLNKKAGNAKIPVSSQSVHSFLSEDRILDILDAESVMNSSGIIRPEPEIPGKETPENTVVSISPGSVTADLLSEEAVDMIVQRVVEKMSTDVVSEIAWEVVPELSEILIRRSIEENHNS